MVPATDGLSWSTTGKQGLFLADRLGTLFPQGKSAPLYIFKGDFHEKSRDRHGKRQRSSHGTKDNGYSDLARRALRGTVNRNKKADT